MLLGLAQYLLNLRPQKSRLKLHGTVSLSGLVTGLATRLLLHSDSPEDDPAPTSYEQASGQVENCSFRYLGCVENLRRLSLSSALVTLLLVEFSILCEFVDTYQRLCST